MTSILLVSLLALLPHSPHTRCIEARQAEIAATAAAASEATGTPVAILLVVGLEESHLGCAGESDWGAPASRSRRHVAGTPYNAAHALARSFAVCGTWLGAVHRFRCGLCVCRRVVGYTADGAMRLVERVHRRAGVAVPGRMW